VAFAPHGATDREVEVAEGRRRRIGAGVLLVSVAGHLVAESIAHGSRHLGARDDEVARRLPGDEIDVGGVGRARRATRAVTIAAPPEAVWPWLVQMGYGRGGWYAIDRLERMIGAGDFLTGGSATAVVPELQGLGVGDRVPLNADHGFVVARCDPPPADPSALVLVLPQGPLGWVSTYAVLPDGAGTRLVVRTRLGAHRWSARPALLSLELGHALMETVQLVTLRSRIERVQAVASSASGGAT
jgi:hypothetical protein